MAGIVNQPALADLARPARGSILAQLVDDLTPQLGGDLDLNGNNIDFPTTANISDCLDEDNMTTDSATMLATQQSIKAYADSLVVSQADQAALEAETNENTYTPPDLIKHSPGVAKGWVQADTAAGRTSSHNVSSVNDGGTGIVTVNWDTDFSGSAYCVIASAKSDATVWANVRNTSFAAGVSIVHVFDTTDPGDLTDPNHFMVAAFGDQ